MKRQGCVPFDTTVLGPGEIAKILGCSHRYVTKLIDHGVLPGYRLPHSTHRRVRREDFLKFCADNNMRGTESFVPEQMFDAEDIARIVDMPIVTVRRWFKEGTIKTVVSQRKPRVTMSDLLEFCNRNSLRMRLG